MLFFCSKKTGAACHPGRWRQLTNGMAGLMHKPLANQPVKAKCSLSACTSMNFYTQNYMKDGRQCIDSHEQIQKIHIFAIFVQRTIH
ncbi:hypothetical protein [Vandammella animalimorsus]|uniref:hypothetical protein n=1 Tax=Vandammella animalimorsus TaxID=2029117 RepID=UPI0011C42260|nr:hypothetical protein [Vandammella animalimorsus]